ncbi:peptidoglycan DD-metalloendopeptidase family protein [Neobacillus vireti]|uniref:peptidoglycan DD-metalloendopeptidase family protein n=1 Tax=Neobacillus vireti TaxID=220686 RepID=UPI002FFD9FDB
MAVRIKVVMAMMILTLCCVIAIVPVGKENAAKAAVESASTPAWTWPVPGYTTISSYFGENRSGSIHKGIDIPAPLNTPFVAVEDGVVELAGHASGFGNWIVIKHSTNLYSIYGHMYDDGVYVKPGDTVKKGQIIGAVGSNGESSGPHLHLEACTAVYATPRPCVDPLNYLGTQEQYPKLQYGDTGPYVVKLQTLLEDKGYDVGVIDGDFGSRTKNAVILFQQDNGLTADGIVGQQTWQKLLETTQSSLAKVNVQLNGAAFNPGFYGNGTTYVYWRALDKFKISYTFKGNGIFLIEGRTVQAKIINGGLYIPWNLLSPKMAFKSIAGGFNFIYSVATPINIQLNGKAFNRGYFKNNNAYVYWRALNTLKIPYSFKGNGVFIIGGQKVLAETINGVMYIRWNQLSPGKITYTRITGGYNFIYTP